MSSLRYLQDEQVAERFGVNRATIWRWVKQHATFPKPVSLSPGCTRWLSSDIDAWEIARAEARPRSRAA